MEKQKDNSDVLFSIDESGLCRIKLVGEIRYNTSAKGFLEFVNERISGSDVKDVVIDLHRCDYIDSTNIGILVQIEKLQKAKSAPMPRLFYSQNSKVYDAIDDVNINKFFDVRFCEECTCDSTIARDSQSYEKLPKSKTTKIEISKIMLETHKLLSDLDEENKTKFESVIKYLKKEVVRKN